METNRQRLLPILQVGHVLVSPDILTERFCCDLSACKGACCVEGDAGAPVTPDEVMEIEGRLDSVWSDLSASAQAVVDRQGVAYVDREGDLVTSIVGGKDCVFTCYDDLEIDGTTVRDCCLCALERAARKKPTAPSAFVKPISCALYPIRAKQFGDGTIGLNYNRWAICRDAVSKGEQLGVAVYQFLKEPLVRRFGQAWYDELCALADELRSQDLIS